LLDPSPDPQYLCRGCAGRDDGLCLCPGHGLIELMYETFYGLQDRPFDLTPSPRFLVLTDSHREALRNLQYGIASRKGITLLIGEAGAGKTTVIRAAVEAQSQKVHCAHVNN